MLNASLFRVESRVVASLSWDLGLLINVDSRTENLINDFDFNQMKLSAMNLLSRRLFNNFFTFIRISSAKSGMKSLTQHKTFFCTNNHANGDASCRRGKHMSETHAFTATEFFQFSQVSNYVSCMAARKSKNTFYYQLLAELASDHSGETGAVFIYIGALKAYYHRKLNNLFLLNMIQHHMKSENIHLSIVEKILPSNTTVDKTNYKLQSNLLPLWRMSGFFLGYLPLLFFGEKGFYCTIYYVEYFVEIHYNNHLKLIKDYIRSNSNSNGNNNDNIDENEINNLNILTKMLKFCCNDEVEHQNEAFNAYFATVNGNHTNQESNNNPSEFGFIPRTWGYIVENGSKMAVAASKVL